MEIKKGNVNSAEKIWIDRPQWGYRDYVPGVFVQITYDDMGFYVKFTVEEKEPLAEKTEHFSNVHEDSCVEFFAKFDPEHSDKYINIEVNANGATKAAIRTDRENSAYLSLADIEDMEVNAQVLEDCWTVSYRIPSQMLERLYPEFRMKDCKYIKANFYKCGNLTKIKHYVSLFDLGCPKPDFHRPEYFGRMDIVL